jgi:ribonuclease HI
MSDSFLIHTDGGARGNPGPAGFAFTIERPGDSDVEVKGYLGVTTNNVAEYTALVKALEHAKELGGRRLIIQSDSELLVQQMNGNYKVRNPGLLPLYRKAQSLVDQFDHVEIRHIYREQNKRADQLCNEAMDSKERTPEDMVAQARAPAKPAPARPAPAANRDAKIREQGIAILRSASQAWQDDEEDAPTPEQVWDQIWRLVGKSGAG